MKFQIDKMHRIIYACFATLFLWGCQPKDHRLIKNFVDGKLVKEYFVDTRNKKDGYYREYFPNGKVKCLYNYLDDTLNGEQKSFYENGSLEVVGYYKNNQLDSIENFFYPTSRLKSELYRFQGKLFGVQKGYLPNGRLKNLYFMANDSIMCSSLDLDTSGRITRKNGNLAYCIYNKNILQGRDTLGVVFYTYYPPSYQYECELVEQKKGMTARRTKTTLEEINHNQAVLIQKANNSAGDYRIGLSVRIFDNRHQLSFADSTFLEYTVLN